MQEMLPDFLVFHSMHGVKTEDPDYSRYRDSSRPDAPVKCRPEEAQSHLLSIDSADIFRSPFDHIDRSSLLHQMRSEIYE